MVGWTALQATFPWLDASQAYVKERCVASEHSQPTRCPMVQLRRQEPVTVYQVLDVAGRPIGEVMQPAGEPVMGRGEGTVLLVRRRPGLHR